MSVKDRPSLDDREEQDTPRQGLTRRKFVIGSAATGAAALVPVQPIRRFDTSVRPMANDTGPTILGELARRGD